jgi:hypothetical protein
VIRAGARAQGRIVLAPDGRDEVVRLRRALETWPNDGSTRAVLARTNRELLPAVVVALELGWPFRAPRIDLLIEDPTIDALLETAAAMTDPRLPLLVRLGGMRERTATGAGTSVGAVTDAGADPSMGADPGRAGVAAALVGWAAGFCDLATFAAAVRATRERLQELRRDDAPFSLATAHSTKGLEFDHVVVIGMESGRFPSRRSVQDAEDPVRALEEERRLGYVAWTRARKTLTLLYDPLAPSSFLLEAFSPAELGIPA